MLSYYYLFYTIIMPTHHISPPNRTIERQAHEEKRTREGAARLFPRKPKRDIAAEIHFRAVEVHHSPAKNAVYGCAGRTEGGRLHLRDRQA